MKKRLSVKKTAVNLGEEGESRSSIIRYCLFPYREVRKLKDEVSETVRSEWMGYMVYFQCFGERQSDSRIILWIDFIFLQLVA